MSEKIEVSFRDLIASLQAAKLYGAGHPLFKKSIDKAYLNLQDILKDRPDFVIGIVGEELACEKEIFFELSKITRPMILYLKDRGIERITFHQGLMKEELEKFVAFLATSKEAVGKDPQEYLSLIGIRNISIGKLKVSEAPSTEAKQFISSLNIYESCLDKASQSIDDVLNAKDIDNLILRFSINNIMESLVTQHQEFLKLTTLKRYDRETFAHLLNVAILSMYFSSKVGFDKNDVLEIGVAALFHDIGKLYISRKIIAKTARLSDAEFVRMKSHPILGAEILLKYVDALGVLPVVVAFEHHLKYNLSGYPKAPFIQKPHIASLIVSICDVYDALSQRRSYKADYSPDMIYNIMIKEKKESFGPELIDNFFKVIGVWPIGSILSLSDGSVAVVKDENAEDIFLPKVEVIYPEDKRGFVDLREEKERIKIDRFLNPWKEGKEYLHLIKGR
jgi:putative nucleotidyltransferase with HDIG domain